MTVLLMGALAIQVTALVVIVLETLAVRRERLKLEQYLRDAGLLPP